MSVVTKVEGSAKDSVGAIMKHPIMWVLLAMVFAAFLFPAISRFLANQKINHPSLPIPDAFTGLR